MNLGFPRFRRHGVYAAFVNACFVGGVRRRQDSDSPGSSGLLMPLGDTTVGSPGGVEEIQMIGA